MRFAVTLFALTILSQTFVPAFADSTSTEADAIASVPLIQSTSVNVLGGEGAASSKHLQLTDNQKEKFFELKNKLLSDAGPKKVALAEQKRLMKDLLTKDVIDRKAVLATQDKINSLKTDLANVFIASRLDMQEELTPEQRKTVRYRGLKSGGRLHGHHGKANHHGSGKANISSEPNAAADDDLVAASL